MKPDAYTLSGKSGTGILTDTDMIMWLVGYLERNDSPYFYAMNFKTNDFGALHLARYEITKDILRELELID